MYILQDMTDLVTIPRKIKKPVNKPYIRMECVLQTAGDFNRNGRTYSKQTLQESIDKIMDRVKDKSFLGELDHPISKNPSRQLTVLYKEASHVIVDLGWEGNSLVGVLESLNTPKGQILKGLAEQSIPVGFSYRGMGDLRPVLEGGKQKFSVVGPLHTVTWDSVSFPSHATAKMRRISEGVDVSFNTNENKAYDLNKYSGIMEVTNDISTMVLESIDINTITKSSNGYICTESGVCYLPNDYDYLVEKRKKYLMGKFN